MDLPGAKPDLVKEQLLNMFEIDPDDVILASAKTGMGIQEILTRVVTAIPSPNKHGNLENLRLLLQDSWYDNFKGAVNLVQVIDGVLRLNDQVTSIKTGKSYPIKTLSILTPNEIPVKALYPGQVGCFTSNLRTTKDVLIGDTFHKKDRPVEPLMEITPPKPMVFAGFYPSDASEHSKMKSAIEKVSLNDSSVTTAVESSEAMGAGWRIGFLGVLHMEVFSQRLEQEYGASVVITSPTVPYKAIIRPESRKRFDMKEEVLMKAPSTWIEKTFVEKYLEPYVKGTIIAPFEYENSIMALCREFRGELLGESEKVDDFRIKLEYSLPLSEIIIDFFSELKRVTSGYGSFDYEEDGYQEIKLVLVEILINKVSIPELAFICPTIRAREFGRRLVEKMKKELPRQQYDIGIQAAVGSKILARENIKAYRKDVTAKCYGGDLTRQMKLLSRQAEGKKKLKALANIQVSKETFLKLLQRK